MEDANTIQIRQANAYDIDAIAEVQINAWQSNFCNEKLDQAINNAFCRALKKRMALQFEQGYQVLVAEDAHEILGFVGFCMHSDATQIAEINAFYLNNTSLHQNIGPLLCQAALTEIKKSGYQEAAIWVLEDNSQLKSFYESLGFQATPIIKDSELEGQTSREVEYRIPIN
jgi:L-amino acid N-acyltransferase YncA